VRPQVIVSFFAGPTGAAERSVATPSRPPRRGVEAQFEYGGFQSAAHPSVQF
jgi:hypothetical protein